MAQTTHYANVDLVLKSTEDLSPLVRAFGDKVMVLDAEAPTARNEAILEVHHEGGPSGAINSAISSIPSRRTRVQSGNAARNGHSMSDSWLAWSRGRIDPRSLQKH